MCCNTQWLTFSNSPSFFCFSKFCPYEPVPDPGALLQNGGRAVRTNDSVLVETPLWGLCLQNRELSLLVFSLTHSALTSKYRSDVLSCASQTEAGCF